jgi:hypothetical protein
MSCRSLSSSPVARGLGRGGIAHLRVPQAEQLQSILSGDKPLPAATVGGDRLRRVAITYLWLTPAGAARVGTEDETGLRQALADDRLTASTDRHGQELVFALDLRAAGLLDEPDPQRGIPASPTGWPRAPRPPSSRCPAPPSNEDAIWARSSWATTPNCRRSSPSRSKANDPRV